MTSLSIFPSPLKGTVMAQPSKSITHRAIICAALSKGQSKIDNVVLSEDIKATIRAVRALGVEVYIEESNKFKGRKLLNISSNGVISLKDRVIDCSESGSTARFLMPITRMVSDRVEMTGHGRLIERPFSVYKELFIQKGIKYSDNDGKMPITLEGKLPSGEYSLPGDISSQFISGLLFTLPVLEGPSKITVTNKPESLSYILMTLKVLKDYGITVYHDAEFKCFDIPGNQVYQSVPYYVVEGDWSQAAFFCVMGVLSESITVEGLKMDSLQGDRAILDILKNMGAEPEVVNDAVTFSKTELNAVEVDASHIPDLVPAIGVAASLARGTTIIKNAARLRIKESDRLKTTCSELNALGAKITEKPDGLIIEGVSALNGGDANGSGDHRIVMAVASASAACRDIVTISGCDAVSKSYPDFWNDFKKIGGKVRKHE